MFTCPTRATSLFTDSCGFLRCLLAAQVTGQSAQRPSVQSQSKVKEHSVTTEACFLQGKVVNDGSLLPSSPHLLCFIYSMDLSTNTVLLSHQQHKMRKYVV